MKQMTEQNMINAFGGESMANMRCRHFFEWSYETEKMHKALFEKAKQSVDSGKDVELGAVQVCNLCGYTLEGDAPERCPVCNATRDKFTAFA